MTEGMLGKHAGKVRGEAMMSRKINFVVVVAAIAMVAAAVPVGAQTVVSLGSAMAPAGGATVVVPIHVRVASGGLLGPDQPNGRAIQGLAFKVVYSPAEAVAAVKVRRAGITAGLSPLFETSPRAQGSVTMLVSFDESNQRIPFTTSGEGDGDLVGEVEVTLAPNVADGTIIKLSLDRGTSALSNQAGTIVETAMNGQLQLRDGEITVGRAVRRQLRENQP